MHIAINAVALRSAGGRSVAMNFLRAFQQNPDDHTITLFAPEACGYEEFASSARINVQFMPAHLGKMWLRPFADHFWLNKQIEQCSPDVIFSMGNFAVPSERSQVVLFMWPYATYPDSEVWTQMSLTDRWMRRAKIRSFRRRLKYATVVAPQTTTSSNRLKKYFPEVKKLQVVPTAVALNQSGVSLGDGRRAVLEANDRKKLLCLTRYYPHKNLEIFLALGERIKAGNKPYAIVLTIAENQHRDVAKLLTEIKTRGLEDVILNIGPVPMDEVPALYKQSDGLLLPTLLESFSGTYVDAMHFKKPIFTSERDFARDVCGEHAFYFNPHDADNILSVIEQAFGEQARVEDKINQAALRLEEFPNWHKVADMYLELMQTVV